MGNLKEVALLFTKLGIIGFGGPAVHISMMEKEVVIKRKWISGQHFLDLVGATNLIPGPNSTEMAMHCGHERAGWKGLVVAGICFILPAVIITASIAWAYSEYGHLPYVKPFLHGIKPAIIAVIISLVISLGRKAVNTRLLALIGFVAFVLALSAANEILVLFGAGTLGILIHLIRGRHATNGIFPFFLIQASNLYMETSNPKLFFTFLKIGSILYGSGYVLFGFLDAELVSTGLLTRPQLIDAVAIGQLTPGPVFSAATFIGWQINGLEGAVAATLGIFLPSFLFVALLNPLIPKLRKSRLMSVFLDTVNVASVAIILSVSVEMAKESLVDWRAILIAVASLALLLVFKNLNSAFVVIGGAMAGYLFSFL